MGVLLVGVLLAASAVLVWLVALMREFRATMDRARTMTPVAPPAVLAALVCLTEKVDRLLAGGVRIEAASVVVADDLAEARHRADVTVGIEGAAADAASRTGDS